MSDSPKPESSPRVTQRDGLVFVELPRTHVDGYRVVAEWSQEDGCWVARLTGLTATTSCLGTGIDREGAILDLCCALACLCDALTPPSAEVGDIQPVAVPNACQASELSVLQPAAAARLRKVIDRKIRRSRILDYEPTMVTVSIADLELLLLAASSPEPASPPTGTPGLQVRGVPCD